MVGRPGRKHRAFSKTDWYITVRSAWLRRVWWGYYAGL